MKELSLKELQSESLAILNEVHSFCVTNDIRYSLAYGTLIGAVRHKGFIPWDDDLDIVMPRTDYERFCRTFKADGLEVVSRITHDNCLIEFARVCDTRKTSVHTLEPWIRGHNNLGVWIDIMAYDAVPDDYEEFHAVFTEAHDILLRSFKARRSLRELTNSRSLGYNLNTIKKRLFALFTESPEQIIGRLDEIIAKHEYGSTNHIAQLTFPSKEEYLEKECMEQFTLVPFEESQFYITTDYHKILTPIYGDYMQLPPMEEQCPKQDYIHFYWKE